MKVNKLNDVEALRTRSALRLPEPQMSEGELQEIVNLGSTGEAASEAAAAGSEYVAC